jgi:predicted nucleic acid-binding protein
MLSELRKARPSKKFIAWMRSQDRLDLGLTVITLSKVERGTEKVRKSNLSFSKALSV